MKAPECAGIIHSDFEKGFIRAEVIAYDDFNTYGTVLKAKEVLEKAGFIVKVTDVVALPVVDKPGGLAELLKVIDKYQLSVEYMYAFTFGHEETAVMVFRFDDPNSALDIFKQENIEAIEAFNLFK